MKKAFRAAIVAATIAAAWLSPITGALASQNSCILPNTGTLSGLSLVNDANACINSVLSLYSGASAPSPTTNGMLWYNTTTSYIQQYDGASWLNLWFVDATNHLSTPLIGGGSVSAVVATSGSTLDVGSVPQSFMTTSGGGSISSFGSSASVGSIHIIRIGSTAMTWVYNATSLILPTGNPIVAEPGDVAVAIYLGSGNWQVLTYTPATGFAVASSFPLGSVLFGDYGTTPGTGVLSKFVYGFGQALTRTSFPAYTAAVTRSQTGTLTASNPTITAIGNTQGFAVGMPVEGTGIAAACTIASFVANTSITLNSGSCVTGTGSQTVNVFLTGYGAGGSGSTVGVKDCRGRVVAGRDDLGGTAAGRLTTATFGLATGDNLTGGAQGYTQAQSDLPNISTTFTGTSGSVSVSSSVGGIIQNATIVGGVTGGAGTEDAFAPGASAGTVTSTGSFTPHGTNSSINGGVTQTSINVAQPTVVSDCIVAVLP